MALGGLKDESDLKRWLEREMHEQFGLIAKHRVVGAEPITLKELSAAPGAVSDSVSLYAVDNGAGKTVLYAIFPTGAPVQVAIEP